MKQPIIDLQTVTKTYAVGRTNAVHAVDGAALQINQGEIVALTGASGSGKSTLMHLIAGLDRPSSGQVLVDGQAVEKFSERQLARYRNQTIGIVFQFFYLQPFLNVARNVEVPLMFAGTRRRERPERIRAVIEAVGLADRATFLPQALSGGQMQRVAIARALVNRPRILLADEPTGNLDSQNSEAILRLFQKIRTEQGTTIVIVTHDPAVAAQADRTIRIKDGRVAA